LIIKSLPFRGLKLIHRQALEDSRGFLSRLFCCNELSEAGWDKNIAQVNHTYTSQKGTVRGMHYQRPPNAEMKLVTCIMGEIWDVVVDLRLGSETYLEHYAVSLSSENGDALLIPEGFAHGFQALTDNVHLLYCHSAFYSSGAEGGLNLSDDTLAIDWPLSITDISDRDRSHPKIDSNFIGLSNL
jgi:dTDP-4-dehydrorhamnose 3,5-epimerase